MNELLFVVSVVLLFVLVYFLAKIIRGRQTGRKPGHPVYQASRSGAPRHRPAAHSLVHSHSSKRLHAKEDVWHDSRAKAGETRWEPGVIVANKILTDSELALEERERAEGQGMHSVDYSPTDTPRSSPGRARSGTGSRRS